MRYIVLVALLTVVGCSRKGANASAERAAAEARVRDAKAAETAARKAEAEAKAAEERLRLAEAARAERESAEAEAVRIQARRAVAQKTADAEAKVADAEAKRVAAEEARRKRDAEIDERLEKKWREDDARIAAETAEMKARISREVDEAEARRKSVAPEKKNGVVADDPKEPTRDKGVEVAKAAVLRRLKCPSTAKLEDTAWARMSRKKPENKKEREYSYGNWTPNEKSKDDVWSVDLTVDAENSYGAMVRDRWHVLVRWDGVRFVAEDSWSLNDAIRAK